MNEINIEGSSFVLLVKNLEQTVQFYSELGFKHEVIGKKVLHHHISRGKLTLILIEASHEDEVKSISSRYKEQYFDVFCYTNAVDLLTREFKEKNVPIVRGPHYDQFWSEVTIRDINGYQLSFGGGVIDKKGDDCMKPRVTVITLGVDDLDRALKFYRDGLGLSTEGIVGTEFEHGAVAFFDLQEGLRMAIWKRKDIAFDTKLEQTIPSPTEFTIGHNVGTKEEVDTVMEEARKAGARITVPAHSTFWGGYSGYFQDPDGHLWEVVWNPEWEMKD